ncbi:uncharacterized protein BDV17DRAFT_290606 [Aspergillus undulatus]|uniref:uncharacterized protein n=1 Tax=Aspergillus undulatus TaxID=1810928 RepID=UPI003CCCA57B
MHYPPYSNNSYHQYLHKLISKTQPRPLTSVSSGITIPRQPPSRYTPAVVSQIFDHEDGNEDSDEDFDDYDSSYDYEDTKEHYPTTAPISFPATAPNANPTTVPRHDSKSTINLDSSIMITGDGNTVAVSSGQAHSQPQSQSQSQSQQSQPTATTQNSIQCPQSKLANTAAAIIAALK